MPGMPSRCGLKAIEKIEDLTTTTIAAIGLPPQTTEVFRWNPGKFGFDPGFQVIVPDPPRVPRYTPFLG